MTAFVVGNAERKCVVCGAPAARVVCNGISPALCDSHLPATLPTKSLDPSTPKYPSMVVGTLWLDERDCHVWRLSDMCEREDGNASIVLARIDMRLDDTESPRTLAVTQRWLSQHPDYTQIDTRTAGQYIGARPWYRRVQFWMRNLFRRRAR